MLVIINDNMMLTYLDLDVSDRLSYKEKKFVAKMKELNDSHFEGNCGYLSVYSFMHIPSLMSYLDL